MKILFVGDVHNHSYIFEDVTKLDAKYNFDRVIFLGDYVDDWLTDNHKSLETLEQVIQLKKSNPEKYTFLIGNHELSYLGYKCSGHQFELEDVMEMKLKENIDCFDFYTSVQCKDKEYICTHAGINNDYIKQVLNGKDEWRETLDEFNKHKIAYLQNLSMVSYHRGGNSPFSSFVWADKNEQVFYNMTEQPIIPNQIMGHTPVREINVVDDFIFIDTHSTYKDGTKYGDKSYLMWNENEFEVLFSDSVNE